MAAPATLGGRVTHVGPSILGRAHGPDPVQLDIVGVERATTGRPEIRVLGEAKHRNRPMGIEQLERLDALRRRLGAPEARLLLVCDAGFDRHLARAERARRDLELVDAERLLTGD